MDQTRFKQILINLVSNAIKFSRPDGSVTVPRNGSPTTCCSRSGTTGIGIKPEDQGGLFKPFKQASPAQEMNREGIGLGLAITGDSWSCTAATIWVESAWGKGTTMYFRIPMIVDAACERTMQAGMLLEALERENTPREAGEAAGADR